MNNLVNIIGLSPSEMSSDEYIEKVLKPERERVRSALADFVSSKTPSKGKKAASSKKITKTALKKLMQEFDMTAAEIQDLIKGDKDGGG